LAERGYDFRTLSRELVEYFRNLAIINTVDKPEKILEFTPDEIERYQRLSSQASVEELTLFLDELFKIESHVKNASFPRYVFELGLVKASFIKGMASVGEILKALSSSGTTSSSSKSPLKKLAILQKPITRVPGASDELVKKNLNNDPFSSQQSLAGDNFLETWKQVINTIEKSNQRLAWFLAEIKPSSFTESEVIFTLKGGMDVHEDHLKKSLSEIEKALAEVKGIAIKVTVQTIDDKPQKDILKKQVMSNPVVEQVMKEFDGKMINVKPLN
jgi:DNA polymerase III gamma/tau subunit